MKLKYMTDFKRVGRPEELEYDPIGVWVQGPGPGIDLLIKFLPGHTDAKEHADKIIQRLVDRKTKNLPDDFLNYWQETISVYRGMRNAPVETTKYKDKQECANAVLRQLKDQATLWHVPFELDAKYLAIGAKRGKMPVYERTRYGLVPTKQTYPDILPGKKDQDFTGPAPSSLDDIRANYGPILTPKLQEDIKAGKVKPPKRYL